MDSISDDFLIVRLFTEGEKFICQDAHITITSSHGIQPRIKNLHLLLLLFFLRFLSFAAIKLT